MTLQVDHKSRTADIAPTVLALRTLDEIRANPRPLPTWSDDDAWTGATVVDIADCRPCSRAELVDTYGTDDPEWLAAHFALDMDVEAARRYASEVREVAA